MSREEENELAGIGELSEPIFNERGGFPESKIPPVYGAGAVPGVGNGAMDQGAYMNEAPSQETSVATVYDARPINARDFYVGETVASGSNMRLEYTVPDGYIAVLRGVRWTCGQLLGNGAATLHASIRVDNTTVPEMDNLQGNGCNPDWITTYVLAEAGRVITLYMEAQNLNDFVLQMRGNLLLSRGLPLQNEPGSRG